MVGKYKHKSMKRLSKAFRGGMSGFTLIEMLIVIAIIAILAGIVLTGVRGFQETARDTKRIGDTRNIQNLLELYFTRFGNYPAVSGWEGDLDTLGNVPSPPPGAGQTSYGYTTLGSPALSYCLQADLENDNSAAEDDASGAPCSGDCTDNDVFCATSG